MTQVGWNCRGARGQMAVTRLRRLTPNGSFRRLGMLMAGRSFVERTMRSARIQHAHRHLIGVFLEVEGTGALGWINHLLTQNKPGSQYPAEVLPGMLKP